MYILAKAIAWTDDVGVPTIEASDLTPSALEEMAKSMLPFLQTLLFNLIVSIIIFVVGRKVISLILKILKDFLTRTGIDTGIRDFLVSAARMLLYLLLIFMIVGQLGINTASIVTIIGAAGLAISMSLQGSLSNVAGGILILLMKPFKVGDYISTGFGDGTVRSIGLVYTTLLTIDNRTLSIPNGVLSNSAVFDASAMPERRLDIAAGISYGSDLRKAKEIMEQVYRDCPLVLADKDINVHVSSLGDSSVVIECFGWVSGADYLKAKWTITEEIKLQFDVQGISIPYPQMDVHLDAAKSAPVLAGSGEKAAK